MVYTMPAVLRFGSKFLLPEMNNLEPYGSRMSPYIVIRSFFGNGETLTFPVSKTSHASRRIPMVVLSSVIFAELQYDVRDV